MGEHPKFDPARFIADCGAGNKDAEAFGLNFLRYAHLLDDCVDGEVCQKWTLPEVCDGFLGLALSFAGNPFFQANKEALMSVICAAASDYLDSERTPELVKARVLSTSYFLVFVTIARLAGGWDHARKFAETYRGWR